MKNGSNKKQDKITHVRDLYVDRKIINSTTTKP